MTTKQIELINKLISEIAVFEIASRGGNALLRESCERNIENINKELEEEEGINLVRGYCTECNKKLCTCPERQPNGTWVENKTPEEPKFKEGDKIIMKEDCINIRAGEICTLHYNFKDNEAKWDFLIAYNDGTEKDYGCNCPEKWQRLPEEPKNITTSGKAERIYPPEEPKEEKDTICSHPKGNQSSDSTADRPNQPRKHPKSEHYQQTGFHS